MRRVAAAVLTVFLLVLVPDAGQRASAEQSQSPSARTGQKAHAPAEVKLAPPLKHWVFALPPDRQVRLVSLRVRAQDERGQPVPNAQVMGYCEPWDYMLQVQSDAGGQALIRGPVGDWTFRGACGTGQGRGFLAQVRCKQVVADREIVLRSREVLRVGLRLARQSEHRPGGQSEKGAVEPLDALVNFVPRGLSLSQFIGGCHDGQLALSSMPGLPGWLAAFRPAGPDRPGVALLVPWMTGSSAQMVLRERDLACLDLQIDPFAGGAARLCIGVRPEREDFYGDEMPLYVDVPVPPAGTTVSLLLSPGNYDLAPSLFQGNDWQCNYVPRRVSVAAGQHIPWRLGGAFSAAPVTCLWHHPGLLSLWFDLADAHGNFLLHVSGNSRLFLAKPINKEFQHGSDGKDPRCFEVDHSWDDPSKAQPLSYAFSARIPLLGEMKSAGRVPTAALADSAGPVAGQTEHFRVIFRADPYGRGKRLAQLLESAFQWLSDHYAGPVRTSHGGPWTVLTQTRVGLGMAWPDGIALSVYAYAEPYDYCTGSQGMLFHELGHIYENSPPRHCAEKITDLTRPAPGEGSFENEAQATLIAAYCIRAVMGERGYRWANRRASQLFFKPLIETGKTCNGYDAYTFIFLYVHARYGQAVNRDYLHALHGSQGNLEKLVLGCPHLKTPHEMVCAAYSCLAKDNLAWLFRWSGFPVADSTIAKAMAWFKEQGVRLPGEKE